MDAFAHARVVALSRRAELLPLLTGLVTAQALLHAATRTTGVSCQAVPPDDPVLDKAEAVLDRDVPAIFYKISTSPEQAHFQQAHEFGHFWLESEGAYVCRGADLDVASAEDALPFGVQRVEGYGPKARRETAANVFAREFLLPASEARRLFVEEGLNARAIAETCGVPLSLVHQQLSRGLLLPPAEGAAPQVQETGPSLLLDASQKTAAEWPLGPFLLEAGPGTGKTRTLVERVLWLGQTREVDPARMLVLTFSNKAAGELRERIARAWPDGGKAWTGTFHAFGLDILRQHGHLIGLESDLPLLDPGAALELLEAELPHLPLQHYLRLYEPTQCLSDILKAISRAKDELVEPQQYRVLAQAMRDKAVDEEAVEIAERALEVASIYHAYERALRRERSVDFGDLIGLTFRLLDEHAAVREAVTQQYRHVLVDEYQDVNRASSRMLQRLAGDGGGLWVVGDARQSIYRFRGASPRNIREFERDFPGGARRALDVNYRSKGPIVRTVEAFAPSMRASEGGLPARWTPQRGEAGEIVAMEIATDMAAEAAGMARAIRARAQAGVALRDQAILCRSHTNLARYALLLEALDVPVLYLGDLFERPEIRDLLSLLSLVAEPNGGGLLRVARLPEYAVPLSDLRIVLAMMREREFGGLAALNCLADANLSVAGREGLERLRDALAGAVNQGPSAFLATYLFENSTYVRRLLQARGVKGQQQRLAVFQFLQVASEVRVVAGRDPKRAVLDWVRRLEIFGEERQLRSPPAAAGAIDAVRLMTVHASKGLEFKAVYLPALAKTYFPATSQYDPCPPPVGLTLLSAKDTDREEEECLFFVALSRAQDTLCLSRAERYGAIARERSVFLDPIASRLTRSPAGAVSWSEPGPVEPPDVALPELGMTRDEHRVEDLDQHVRCGRTYLYQRIFGLHGGREDNGYVQFHRCVYAVLRSFNDLPADEASARSYLRQTLDAAWARIGPRDHPWESLYYAQAVAILDNARQRWLGGPLEQVEWRVSRPAGTILVRPDALARSGGAVVARRLRTGRAPKKPPDDDIYALYHAGGGAGVSVEVVYLTDDRAVSVPMSDRVVNNRLAKYDGAIADIAAGRFAARPSDRNCPRCPHYFICPTVVTDLP